MRCAGTVQPKSDDESGVMKHVKNWDTANEIYYGPDRDTANFPHPMQPEKPPSVRMGFIPETWFNFFYEKTGVTGPYVFGTGVIATLLSTELWVVEHGFTEFVSFWIAVWILGTKLGPGVSKYLQKTDDDYIKARWDDPIAQAKQAGLDTISQVEKAIWREDGQKYLFEAKKENVALQLEAVYRQRLTEVHQAVKRRLDYQADVETAKRNFEQQHMVNWIVDGVVKGITPQQEKESLNKCIQDLKALAVKA